MAYMNNNKFNTHNNILPLSGKKTIIAGIREEFEKREKGNVKVKYLESDLTRVDQKHFSNSYLVSLVPKGERYILYCTNRYNIIPSCFLISLESCHIMVNDRGPLDMTNLSIIPVKYRFSLPLFNGTIFEGVLRDNKFIITDTSILAGKSMNETTLDSRIEEIKYILEKHYVEDDNISDYELSVLNYYGNTAKNRMDLRRASNDVHSANIISRKQLMYTNMIHNGEIILD